jgi:hypothetical protein
MSNSEIIIAPASLPQEQALNSTSTITLYGGGHKRLR